MHVFIAVIANPNRHQNIQLDGIVDCSLLFLTLFNVDYGPISGLSNLNQPRAAKPVSQVLRRAA